MPERIDMQTLHIIGAGQVVFGQACGLACSVALACDGGQC
jgi:hypothetical protein